MGGRDHTQDRGWHSRSRDRRRRSRSRSSTPPRRRRESDERRQPRGRGRSPGGGGGGGGGGGQKRRRRRSSSSSSASSSSAKKKDRREKKEKKERKHKKHKKEHKKKHKKEHKKNREREHRAEVSAGTSSPPRRSGAAVDASPHLPVAASPAARLQPQPQEAIKINGHDRHAAAVKSGCGTEASVTSARPEGSMASGIARGVDGSRPLLAAPVAAAKMHGQGAADEGVVICCECEDQPADVFCQGCEESYCKPCWGGQHRRGKRSLHKLTPILGQELARIEQPEEPGAPVESMPLDDAADGAAAAELDDDDAALDAELDRLVGGGGSEAGDSAAAVSIGPAMPPGGMAALTAQPDERRLRILRQRAVHTPLRLDDDERRILALLQGALEVSEYTDKVDVYSQSSHASRMLHEIHEHMKTQCGLQMVANYRKGRQFIRDGGVQGNAEWYAEAFEIGRRYKIMNPAKMRSIYGKMMYMLQDTLRQEVRERLRCNLVLDIKTVGAFLQRVNSEEMLGTQDFELATTDLSDATVDRETQLERLADKQSAAARLVERYASAQLSPAQIQRVLDSWSDSNNYLANNEKPVVRIIEYLKHNFKPRDPGSHSLQIGRGGVARHGPMSSYRGGFGFGPSKYSASSFTGGNSGGAKLTHDHATQYTFVYQTFLLWQRIARQMYKLWMCADHDLLHNQYRLQNTGQGLNRVQQCPKVGGEMQRILSSVQQACGRSWVGLSVVHLGDRDVSLHCDGYPCILVCVNYAPIVAIAGAECADLHRQVYPDPSDTRSDLVLHRAIGLAGGGTEHAGVHHQRIQGAGEAAHADTPRLLQAWF